MSSIAGYFSFNHQPADPTVLKRMSNALALHGPDSTKSWQSGPIGLLHRSMRITPEDLFEQQPLTAAEGRFVLVADARIDNREDLAATFGWSSAETRILPDSRFVLEAWLRWQEHCGRHLTGSFCIAVWDNRERNLTLIRDPIGTRSIHYFRNAGFFAFATMPKGLFAVPGVPRELNEEKLADFLVLNHRDHRTTHYKGVYRPAPGHFLRVSAEGKITESCYWQPDFDKRLLLKNDHEYVEAFNELFNKVIRSHLRCRTPVSAFMSGGLDSSAIAVAAAGILKESGERLATFTHVPRAGFNGPVPKGRYADESGRVEKIAAMHDNIDLNLLHPEEEETLTHDADNFFNCMEFPFRNPANRLWLDAILRKQQERGNKVILSGAFGNFTFSWDGSQSLPDRLRRGKLWPVLKETLALSRAQHRPWWRVFGGAILPLIPRARWMHASKQGLRGLLKRAPLWHWHSAIHPEFARKTSVRQRGAALGHDFCFSFPLDSRKARWFALTAPDYVADLQAGWKARYGVEQRFPAVDRRILEFCLSLPEEQFLHHGVSRRLVKRAFGNRLPAEVLYSHERGLQAPDWFEHLTRQKQQLCREVQLLENHPLARRYLDVERLQQLIKNWPSHGWDKGNLYRSMLMRGIMMGRFVRWFEGDNQ